MATVWECTLRKTDQVEAAAKILSFWLLSEAKQIEIGDEDAR